MQNKSLKTQSVTMQQLLYNWAEQNSNYEVDLFKKVNNPVCLPSKPFIVQNFVFTCQTFKFSVFSSEWCKHWSAAEGPHSAFDSTKRRRSGNWLYFCWLRLKSFYFGWEPECLRQKEKNLDPPQTLNHRTLYTQVVAAHGVEICKLPVSKLSFF